MGRGRRRNDRLLPVLQRGMEREEEGEERSLPNKKDRKRAEKVAAKERRRQKFFADFDQIRRLNRQIENLGLYVRDVIGDGNCLFRSLADQIWNDESKHRQMREEICDFFIREREFFEPFIVGLSDEPIEEYVHDMRGNKVWGGHLEIQAASMLHHRNVLIHELDSAVMEITNFPGEVFIQLGYFTDEHYASVRSQSDISFVADDTSSNAELTSEDQRHAEKIVLQQTQCRDREKIRRLLLEHNFDIDTVVEKIWMDRMMEELNEEIENVQISEVSDSNSVVESSSSIALEEDTSTNTSKKKEKPLSKREKKMMKKQEKASARRSDGKDPPSSSAATKTPIKSISEIETVKL